MPEERNLQVLMGLLTDDQKSRFRHLCRELNATNVAHEKEIASTILMGSAAINKLKEKGLEKVARKAPVKKKKKAVKKKKKS